MLIVSQGHNKLSHHLLLSLAARQVVQQQLNEPGKASGLSSGQGSATAARPAYAVATLGLDLTPTAVRFSRPFSRLSSLCTWSCIDRAVVEIVELWLFDIHIHLNT